MTKRIFKFFGIIIIALLLPGKFSFAQDCDAVISINYLTLERDVKTFTLPVFLVNPCEVYGIEVHITTESPGIITAISADTVGGRISGWEEFSYHNDNDNPDELIIFAVANLPAEPETPPLDSGNGLLYNVTFQFECNYEEDTVVNVIMDPVFIADDEGDLYNVSIVNSVVTIGGYNGNRGDANCSGEVLGSDVTYLVNYFRGNIGCPCSRCAGDANGDGHIIGSDVTYLVNYFRGIGPPPPPCDE